MNCNNLFISFYSDDMRFFYSYSKKIPNKSFFYSIFFSGTLYLLTKFKISLNFLKKYDENIIIPNSFEDLIYYEIVQKKFNKDTLIAKAKQYIFYFNFLIRFKKIKYVYLSGDSRMIIKCAEYVALKNNCKIRYFEQGPFGTTILDKKGVNKNCSFRNAKFKQDLNQIVVKNKIKIRWNKYFRAFDFLIYNVLRYKNNHVYNDIATFSNKTRVSIKNKLSNNYVLLILQVPLDANMILNSPNFSNHLDIVKWTYDNLPDGYQLVVREHPNFINSYENELYNFIEKKDKIIFDNNSLNSSIKSSALVVVNNSTVGIEALLKNKKLVVLGDCYYDKLETVFKIKGLEDKDVFNHAIKSKVNKKINISFINYLLKNELIGFHFRDKKYNLKDVILTKKITNLYK